MTITEFILARVAEDEAAAESACSDVRSSDGHWHAVVYEYEGMAIFGWADDHDDVGTGSRDDTTAHISRWDPARVLAECKAKRAIVALHSITDAEEGGEGCIVCHWLDEWATVEAKGSCDTLRALAAIYAAHPDYDESWKL